MKSRLFPLSGNVSRRGLLTCLSLATALGTNASIFNFTASDGGWSPSTQWSWSAAGWFTGGIPSTTGALTSPTLVVPANGMVTGTISHNFGFDTSGGGPPPSGLVYYDGGQLQYSTDHGSTWSVVSGNLITNPSYSVLTETTDNPIAGQGAFVYTSNGSTVTSFTLGTGSSPYETGTAATFTAGQEIMIRLMVASDSSSDSSWLVTALTTTAVPEPAACAGITAAGLLGLAIYRRARPETSRNRA